MEGKLRGPAEAREHGCVLVSGVEMTTGLPQHASRDFDSGGSAGGSRNFAQDDGITQRSVVLPVTGKQERGKGGWAFNFGAEFLPLVAKPALEMKEPIWSGG